MSYVCTCVACAYVCVCTCVASAPACAAPACAAPACAAPARAAPACAAPARGAQRLLESGFDEAPSPDPTGLAVYGRGFYFSKYAGHAHAYTGGSGCLLLAEVAVGNAETVVRRDGSARGAPSAGYDSMVVPGRRLPSQEAGAASGGGGEEFVIFDGSQVLPLCLVWYDMA